MSVPASLPTSSLDAQQHVVRNKDEPTITTTDTMVQPRCPLFTTARRGQSRDDVESEYPSEQSDVSFSEIFGVGWSRYDAAAMSTVLSDGPTYASSEYPSEMDSTFIDWDSESETVAKENFRRRFMEKFSRARMEEETTSNSDSHNVIRGIAKRCVHLHNHDDRERNDDNNHLELDTMDDIWQSNVGRSIATPTVASDSLWTLGLSDACYGWEARDFDGDDVSAEIVKAPSEEKEESPQVDEVEEVLPIANILKKDEERESPPVPKRPWTWIPRGGNQIVPAATRNLEETEDTGVVESKPVMTPILKFKEEIDVHTGVPLSLAVADDINRLPDSNYAQETNTSPRRLLQPSASRQEDGIKHTPPIVNISKEEEQRKLPNPPECRTKQTPSTANNAKKAEPRQVSLTSERPWNWIPEEERKQEEKIRQTPTSVDTAKKDEQRTLPHTLERQTKQTATLVKILKKEEPRQDSPTPERRWNWIQEKETKEQEKDRRKEDGIEQTRPKVDISKKEEQRTLPRSPERKTKRSASPENVSKEEEPRQFSLNPEHLWNWIHEQDRKPEDGIKQTPLSEKEEQQTPPHIPERHTKQTTTTVNIPKEEEARQFSLAPERRWNWTRKKERHCSSGGATDLKEAKTVEAVELKPVPTKAILKPTEELDARTGVPCNSNRTERDAEPEKRSSRFNLQAMSSLYRNKTATDGEAENKFHRRFLFMPGRLRARPDFTLANKERGERRSLRDMICKAHSKRAKSDGLKGDATAPSQIHDFCGMLLCLCAE